ncbi:MAG TPA: DegT/DnrJ/EryC1/StrS family aminotransferase [Terriglobales bacterium]|nr:DegT/DnrJ/EryC1/StrS family aminotransferase [Terriglobales bacterium]
MTGVPFFRLDRAHAELRSQLDAAFARVVDSNHLILGHELAAFEEAFASYCGVRYAVGVGDGLDAISLVLRALDIGTGDEVIVPGHTFIATWLAVSQVGATIVPVEIDLDTFNIDPTAVAAAITSKTRAVIAVHLYGQPAKVDELTRLCQRHRIALIEDAAQAHGAAFQGKRAGSLGTAAAFSFYPTKNLGALGDGGAITTDDDEIANRVRMLRNYGSRIKYEHEESGVNSRLDELQAALLAAKLPGLDAKNRRRREIALRFQQGLSGTPGLVLPHVAEAAEPVWHLYVVRCKSRDALKVELDRAGIGTLIHYPVPPHLQGAYARTALNSLSLPRSEAAAHQVLSLPMWPEMTGVEVDRVIEAVNTAARTVTGSHA